MLYLRFTLINPALYSVHNASPTKIAYVKIQPNGTQTVVPKTGRALSLAERQSIAAFQP